MSLTFLRNCVIKQINKQKYAGEIMKIWLKNQAARYTNFEQ